MRGAASIVAVAALLAGGCRRGQKDVRVVTIDGESEILPRVERSAAGPQSTRSSMQTLRVGSQERRFLLVEPARVDAGKKIPLVLVMHGDGGDAAGFHAAFPFERASGEGAYLAYLDGIGRTWDLETKEGNRDVAFAAAVVDDVAGRAAIDRERVFAIGYSSGGFLSNVIACQRSGLLRAIASSAGGAPYKQAERWPNGYTKCPGQKPIAILAMHGTRDFGVTIDSGRFSAAYWAYVGGCRTDEMETTGYRECRAYRGCPKGKAAVFCEIDGLGHWVWDRAAEAAWTFFEKQSAPP